MPSRKECNNFAKDMNLVKKIQMSQKSFKLNPLFQNEWKKLFYLLTLLYLLRGISIMPTSDRHLI